MTGQSDRWQRFLARPTGALRREGTVLWGGLRDPALWGLLLAALFLMALAVQAAPPFILQAGRRPEDVYLSGFHAVEQGGGRTYRWSTAEGHLRIPGLARAPYRLEIILSSPRPPGSSEPEVYLEATGQALLAIPVGPTPQVYTILLSAEALPGGTLDLALHSNTFTTTTDSRHLGVMWERVALRPAARSAVLAPLDILLWPILAVALTVLLARRLGWPRLAGLYAGAGLALLLAAAVAWARPLLAPGLPLLPLGLGCAWVLLALGQGTVRDLFARAGAAIGPGTERALWTVLALFLALRLAGSLHPAHQTWDLVFHYHRLEQVVEGNLLFTITSGEWRSQETLYLPSLYLLVAPFWALFGGRLIPLEVTSILLDTSSALLVAYMARRLIGRGTGVWLAALLYLTMPQSYLIFSWGIVSNIFGQWCLLLVLAFLVSPAGLLARRWSWLPATGLLLPAVLSHPGTVQLTGVLLAAFLGTVLLVPLPGFLRQAAWRWVLVGAIAVALAVLLYYGYFGGIMWTSLQAMREGANAEQTMQGGFLVRGPVLDADLGLTAVEVSSPLEAVLAGVRELATEARAYYYTWPLVLAIAALAGFALESRSLAIRLASLACVVALLFAIVGLAVNLYVRYMYFLLPFVAIGVAWWLARWPRKGWAGRAVATLAGLFLGLMGLLFWIEHVLYYSAG